MNQRSHASHIKLLVLIMARFKEKNEALRLRALGMSYSQIKQILKIGKGTLSCWLRNYPLSKERISELRDRNEVRIEKFRETMRVKRESRLKQTYKEQKKLILPLNKRELFIAGLFLYWGEGAKSRPTDITVSNTDPSMIKFFIRWMTECLKVEKTKMSVDLHLYQDMEIEKEVEYWSTTLSLPTNQFIRPYVKQTLLSGINHKGGFGHGTCNIRVSNARLAEKVLMGIKVISHKYLKSACNSPVRVSRL